MNILTLKFLNQTAACPKGINWVINNKLLGIPFNVIKQIKGDHNKYITWIRLRTRNAQFDDKGNVIYIAYPGRYQKFGYDLQNNLIHHEDSDGGISYDQEFDEHNKLVHFKDNQNGEFWNIYDEKNRLINVKYLNYEKWFEYYEDNVIHVKNSNGGEYWQEFDNRNNLVYYYDDTGKTIRNTYDSQNNLIKIVTHYSHIKEDRLEIFEYDNRRNIIYYSSRPDGYQYTNKYDHNNNIIFHKSNTITETFKLEYYRDNQLKRCNDLIIPYFNKDII